MSADLEPDHSPLTSRGFIAAAIVLGVIVALGIAIVVSNLIGGGPDAATSADGAAPGQTEQAPAGNSDSVCGLSAVAMTGTVDQPPAAEWTLVGTVAAPRSPESGPGETRGDVRRCFARTPEGALFAAANMAAAAGDQASWPKSVEWYVLDGPGKTKAVGAAGGDTGVRMQIAGFRVLAYTGEKATIDLAVRVSTGANMSFVYDLVWHDGDWRTRVAEDGGFLNPPAQLPDLTGYIPWGGA